MNNSLLVNTNLVGLIDSKKPPIINFLDTISPFNYVNIDNTRNYRI